MNPNPYAAPKTVGGEFINVPPSTQYSFHSDWSTKALRARPPIAWHRWMDVCGIVLLIVWLIYWLSRTVAGGTWGSGDWKSYLYGIPMVFWIWSVLHRHTPLGDLDRYCPGLAGPVHGCFDQQVLQIHGPSMSVLVGRPYFPPFNPFVKSGLLLIPDFGTVPAFGGELDQGKRAISTLDSADGDPMELLSNLPCVDHHQKVVVSCQPSRADFSGIDRTRRPVGQIVAYLLMVFVLIGLTRSHWFELINAYGGLVVLGMIAALVIAIGFGLSWLRFFGIPFGRFPEAAASISPTEVAIANNRLAYSYRNDSLAHFRWKSTGLNCLDRRGRLVFLLPRRCFSETQCNSLAAWFPDSGRTLPSKDYYVGPTLNAKPPVPRNSRW
ncbi:MAG: hypothetical protein KDB00_29940, partial [Planctomycetales bacterium]|nr:hypothetical protein [Planctomycetales bacterium]